MSIAKRIESRASAWFSPSPSQWEHPKGVRRAGMRVQHPNLRDPAWSTDKLDMNNFHPTIENYINV